MKVLFFSHYYPPEGNAPASRVHSMCRRWAAAGHQVRVLTCAPNVPSGVVYPGYRNRWHQREEQDGVEVVRVWTFLAANRGRLRRSLNYLSYLLSAIWRGLRCERPDVVVATSPQFFCGWAGVWVARLRRVPFVLEVRDLWPASIAAVGVLGADRERPPLLLRLMSWFEQRMYRAADRIVTVGDGYAAQLRDRGVGAEKIEVITNGAELELYTPRPADPKLRAEAGAPPEDFLVGYIGTLGMAHQLEVVIEAGRIARERGLERLRFLILGDGARAAELRAELARDDPGNVRILDRRPKAEMPAWLASVDACLVHLRDTPLFHSVLPSKIFEAFAMQRPLLAGVRGQAEALIAAGPAGQSFPPEDAGALVEAADSLARLPDRGAELGAAGRRLVLERFQLDELAARYLRLLEELAQ